MSDNTERSVEGFVFMNRKGKFLAFSVSSSHSHEGRGTINEVDDINDATLFRRGITEVAVLHRPLITNNFPFVMRVVRKTVISTSVLDVKPG